MSTARQRRPQHAPRRSQSRGNSGRARGQEPRRSPRRQQSSRGAKTASRPQLQLRGLLARLRERHAAGRAERAEARERARAQQSNIQQTSADEPPRRDWGRRLARAALRLGATGAVAWALLLAGREVYEYSTTSARFEAKHFIFEPTSHVDDETLRELLAIEPGTNILACDLTSLSERVADRPWVAMATITRHLPDTLEISVVEHRPEAIVLAGRFYLVNAEGRPFKVVERGDRGELPIITGISREAIADAGEQPVPELVEALELIHLYGGKQRPRLGELNFDDDGSLTLHTAEAGTQLRLGRSDYAERLERWDALRAALGDRADRLAVVHLDHESKPDRRDRVVARFASERDEALILAAGAEGLLAQAGSEPESDASSERRPKSKKSNERSARAVGEAAAEAAPLPARAAGKRDRIPSYE
ncbi:MAG: FtsQ-type POTRA domain-containing protein [Myxococcales bacterium]|nr:FtsQ-type POTRA domain-containing protein [Myxococcales bacterium]